MNLIVDNEAPISRIKKFQRAVFAFSLASYYLIRSDGDRLDLFLFPGILADFILRQRGATQ